MNKQTIVEQDWLSLIPHRSPFVQVGKLISASEDHFVTEFEIPEGNLLTRDGIFQESGLLENMAQSAALGFGFNGMKNGQEPKIGYIGAISRVNVLGLPRVGDRITTHVRVTHRLEPVVMIRGEVYHEDRKLLEGEIKLVI